MLPDMKWIIRIAGGLTAVALVALLAGAVFEHRARARVAAQYPPAGRLIDIGGRRMQIDCRGTGTPVVVFEAARDLRGSLSWYLVHDRVAAFTRACAYSRAGILWSDSKDPPNTANGAAHDLHNVLRAAGEPGPFVLVGHSAGGLGILVYTKYYPAEVSGLVFVDASHPQELQRLAAVPGLQLPKIGAFVRFARAFAWAGSFRLLPHAPPFDASEAARIVNAYAPYSFVSATREVDSDHEWFAEAATVHDLGSRPLYVLSGMNPSPERLGLTPDQERLRLELWRQMQNELAALSAVSQHYEDMTADHYVQESDPEQVVAAVRWTVDKVRTAETTQRS
jgi:pimeloyl-ACP methyl ester carboxylesterase